MESVDKDAIIFLRGQGFGYGSISARLGIPESTIKSFCRRQGIAAGTPGKRPDACQHCGAAIEQNIKYKPKKFCSDACRTLWWNSHLRLVNRKAYYAITCAHCGTVFQSYGNKHRRFCCHPCYVRYRYEKGLKV